MKSASICTYIKHEQLHTTHRVTGLLKDLVEQCYQCWPHVPRITHWTGRHTYRMSAWPNTSVQASTGYTPFFLMFGRQARIPADVMYGTPTSTNHSVNDYAATLWKQMDKAFGLARQHLLSKQLRQNMLYNLKVHGKPFKKGDSVWLNTPMGLQGPSKKLYHPWAGPHKVVKSCQILTIELSRCKANNDIGKLSILID